MDWGEILLSLLFSLVITVFFYLLVPVIFCLQHKSFTKKQIKKIVIINGGIVWLIFQILTTEINGEPSGTAAVFLWSAVANGLLKKHCLIEEDEEDEGEGEEEFSAEPYVPDEDKTVKDIKTIEHEKNAEINLSPKGEIPQKYGNYTISASEYNRCDTNQSTQKPEYANKNTNTEIRFCRRCGNKLVEGSVFCNKCGTRIDSGN